eukprot:1923989-Rhodomonas_salina.1
MATPMLTARATARRFSSVLSFACVFAFVVAANISPASAASEDCAFTWSDRELSCCSVENCFRDADVQKLSAYNATTCTNAVDSCSCNASSTAGLCNCGAGFRLVKKKDTQDEDGNVILALPYCTRCGEGQYSPEDDNKRCLNCGVVDHEGKPTTQPDPSLCAQGACFYNTKADPAGSFEECQARLTCRARYGKPQCEMCDRGTWSAAGLINTTTCEPCLDRLEHGEFRGVGTKDQN